MTNQGQLFEGYEVLSDETDIPGLGKMPTALLFPDRDPQTGDEFEVTLRLKLGAAAFGGPLDKDGNGKGQFGRVRKAYALERGFAVTAYLSRDEADKAWNEAHGAQTG